MNSYSRVRGLNHRSTNFAGVTLVELMVSLSLGLLLVFIMGTLYLSSATTFRASTQVARVQENLRFSSHFIQQNLREVGFSFCGSNAAANANTHLDTATGSYFIETGIFGWEYVGSGVGDTITLNYENIGDDALDSEIDNARGNNSAAISDFAESQTLVAGVTLGLPAIIQSLNPIKGSDILALATERETSVNLVNATVQAFDTVAAAGVGANEISLGNIVRVGTCFSSDKFQNNVAAGTFGTITIDTGAIAGYAPGNANTFNGGTPWSAVHPARSKVSVEVLRVYYIGTGASGTPSLFRYESECGLAAIGTFCANAVSNQELVEGVENLQMFYGLDSDSDGVANQYVAADDVPSFADVVSVRLGLMLRSLSSAESIDTATYEVADEVTVDPQNISVTRYVSNATVHLRNKGL